MGWNDWLYLVLEPHPLTHRGEEVERVVTDELAKSLETRLRNRVDQGIDLRAGVRAQSLRVAAEGNRLVINEGQDHGVQRERASERRPRTELDDLFHTSTSEPTVLDDGRVAFRVLHEDDLIGSQAWQDEMVDRTIGEVVNEQLVDTVDRAVRQVELEHPQDRAR